MVSACESLSWYSSITRVDTQSGPQNPKCTRSVFGSTRKYFQPKLKPTLGFNPKSNSSDGNKVIWRRSPKVKSEITCAGHRSRSALRVSAPTGWRTTYSLTSQSGKSTTRGTHNSVGPTTGAGGPP